MTAHTSTAPQILFVIGGIYRETAGVDWQVYIILCTDNSLYTGITTDLERRLSQHGGGRGAKYFRGRRPQRVVYVEGGHTRSSASRREAEIRKLGRAGKLRLVAQGLPADRP